MLKLVLFIFCFSTFVNQTIARKEVKDSIRHIPMVVFSYSAQKPSGDMAHRFGWNSNPGIKIQLKSKSNWLVSLEGSYIYGTIINENYFLKNITTQEGYIIGSDGQYADIRLSERGFTTSASLGKVFPWLSPNLNSGFIFTAGLGFIQHYIDIRDVNGTVPSLRGEYLKGYDRLTNGIFINQFIGYIYISQNRFINFYAGVEFLQGLTKNQRMQNFDTMTPEAVTRNDYLNGFRIGWILPIYRRSTNHFYYN